MFVFMILGFFFVCICVFFRGSYLCFTAVLAVSSPLSFGWSYVSLFPGVVFSFFERVTLVLLENSILISYSCSYFSMMVFCLGEFLLFGFWILVCMLEGSGLLLF